MNRAWLEAQSALYVAVAGVSAGSYDISHVLEGDTVQLVAEPDNAHDPNAIQVLAADGSMLGYIPASYAAVMDAPDWSGRVAAVLTHPETGAPAGLRLDLMRKVSA